MKAGELHDRMAVKPFRPFTIETVNGQSFRIEGEENLFLPKPKPEIAIVFIENQMFIIDIDSINVLAIK
jgi:hypothetical protein